MHWLLETIDRPPKNRELKEKWLSFTTKILDCLFSNMDASNFSHDEHLFTIVSRFKDYGWPLSEFLDQLLSSIISEYEQIADPDAWIASIVPLCKSFTKSEETAKLLIESGSHVNIMLPLLIESFNGNRIKRSVANAYKSYVIDRGVDVIGEEAWAFILNNQIEGIDVLLCLLVDEFHRLESDNNWLIANVRIVIAVAEQFTRIPKSHQKEFLKFVRISYMQNTGLEEVVNFEKILSPLPCIDQESKDWIQGLLDEGEISEEKRNAYTSLLKKKLMPKDR